MPPDDIASTLAAAWVRSRVRQTLGTFTSPVVIGLLAMGADALSDPADMLVVLLAMLAVGMMGWLLA
jgi:hypothetical protein